MDEALRVNGGQGPQHRDHHVEGLFDRDLPAVVGDVGLEGDALDVVHDEVGRVVFVEITGDRRNVRVADELRQSPSLLLEALRAVGELLPAGVHHHGDRGAAYAGGDLAGHELLDGHLRVQLGIQGQVGDTKSALAQHTAHDVPVIQDCPGPQGHREFSLILRQVEPAVGARSLQDLPRLEAVIAEMLLLSHIVPP